MEIANPEDQLALWKLVSDKMWGAFAQQLPSSSITPEQPATMGQSRASLPTKPIAKHVPKAPAKSAHKSQPKAKGRATKPKRAPMAPAPKQLPKPNPQQLSPTQAAKQQTQQHQQLAQHLHKEINKSNPQQRIYPQPPTPIQKPVTPIEPMTNGYDERDKDELVMHSRAQHPFKTISQIKSTLSGRNRGF
jgi:hypothetical protein